MSTKPSSILNEERVVLQRYMYVFPAAVPHLDTCSRYQVVDGNLQSCWLALHIFVKCHRLFGCLDILRGRSY